MRCTALIFCKYSKPDRKINVANFDAQDLQEAFNKTVEMINGFDRKIHTLLVDGKNVTFSLDKQYRSS